MYVYVYVYVYVCVYIYIYIYMYTPRSTRPPVFKGNQRLNGSQGIGQHEGLNMQIIESKTRSDQSLLTTPIPWEPFSSLWNSDCPICRGGPGQRCHSEPGQRQRRRTRCRRR